MDAEIVRSGPPVPFRIQKILEENHVPIPFHSDSDLAPSPVWLALHFRFLNKNGAQGGLGGMPVWCFRQLLSVCALLFAVQNLINGLLEVQLI